MSEPHWIVEGGCTNIPSSPLDIRPRRSDDESRAGSCSSQQLCLGQEIVLDRATHRLFFIPMHYWGMILGIIGVVLFIVEFIK
jgi:hypothetical protein